MVARPTTTDRGRSLRLGLAVTFVWTLLKAWAFYNPKVPDLSVKVFLQPVITSYSIHYTKLYEVCHPVPL